MKSENSIVFTQEKVFFGAGYNPYHFTKDGLKTLCGKKTNFEWKQGEIGKAVKKVKEFNWCKKCYKIYVNKEVSK